MKTEIPPPTIAELWDQIQSPSLDPQSTFIIGISGTEQDRKEFDEQCRAATRKAKEDRFSFLDGLYGRGKGRAKSQGFSKHFKHG